MTSLAHDLYVSVAADILPYGAARRCSFLWAKGHNANAVHSEMRPVYDDKGPDEENAG